MYLSEFSPFEHTTSCDYRPSILLRWDPNVLRSYCDAPGCTFWCISHHNGVELSDFQLYFRPVHELRRHCVHFNNIFVVNNVG